MSRHNLVNVVRFEVVRTLRKPIFWAVTLGVPVLFVALFALSAASSLSAPSSIDEASKATKSFSYLDDSGVIDPAVAAKRGGHPVTDAAAAEREVRDGKAAVFVHFPADPATQTTTVYATDKGIIVNSAYADLARDLMVTSAAKRIGNEQLTKLAAGDGAVQTVTFVDGRESGGLREFLPPLAFVVLFLMTITMLGNQLLNITVEEKENRVTEMILTTIGPTTLITGKVIGVVLIGLVQALVFAAPSAVVGLVAVFVLKTSGWIVLDPIRMLIGLLLYLVGFAMFAGMLICLGAVMPSAKEAGGAFAAVMITSFLPLYAVTMILSTPNSVLPQVLTYFPLTAPVTAMVRNAGGSLSLVTALVVLLITSISAVVLLRLGAALFATGSLAYDRKLNPITILRARTRRARVPSGS